MMNPFDNSFEHSLGIGFDSSPAFNVNVNTASTAAEAALAAKDAEKKKETAKKAAIVAALALSNLDALKAKVAKKGPGRPWTGAEKAEYEKKEAAAKKALEDAAAAEKAAAAALSASAANEGKKAAKIAPPAQTANSINKADVAVAQQSSKTAILRDAAGKAAPKERDLPSQEEVAAKLIKNAEVPLSTFLSAWYFLQQMEDYKQALVQKKAAVDKWLSAADGWMNGTLYGGETVVGGKATSCKYSPKYLFKIAVSRIDAQILAAEYAFGKGFGEFTPKSSGKYSWEHAAFQPSVVPVLKAPYTETRVIWNFWGTVTNTAFRKLDTKPIGVEAQHHGSKYEGPDPKCCRVETSATDLKAQIFELTKYRDEIMALRPPSTGMWALASENFDQTYAGKSTKDIDGNHMRPWYWNYVVVRKYADTKWPEMMKETVASIEATQKALKGGAESDAVAALKPLFSASGVPQVAVLPYLKQLNYKDENSFAKPFTTGSGDTYDPSTTAWRFIRQAIQLGMGKAVQIVTTAQLGDSGKLADKALALVKEAEEKLGHYQNSPDFKAYTEAKASYDAIVLAAQETQSITGVAEAEDKLKKNKLAVESWMQTVTNKCGEASEKADAAEVVALPLAEAGNTQADAVLAKVKEVRDRLKKIGETVYNTLAQIDTKFESLKEQVEKETGFDPPPLDPPPGGGGGGGGGGVMAALAAAAALLLLRS